MQLIQQPEGSRLCGQCVVAMIAGITLEHAVEQMGEGRNYPKQIRSALAELGVVMAKRSIPDDDGSGPDGKTAVAFLTSTIEGKKYSHWIAWDGWQWLDPRLGVLRADYRFKYPPVYQNVKISIYPVSARMASEDTQP